MNVPRNLEIFRSITAFENDVFIHEITFPNPDRSQQRAIQAIAHSRNLDYEYQRGCAKVTRTFPNVDSLDPILGMGTWQDTQAFLPPKSDVPNHDLDLPGLTNRFTSNDFDPSNLQNAFQPPEIPEDEIVLTALVIKNIPFAFKKEQMVELMIEKELPMPHIFNYHFDNGVFRGLAFANYTFPEEASSVIEALHRLDLHGRKLRVEYKKMVPHQERERIEREKAQRRGQLQDQLYPSSYQTRHTSSDNSVPFPGASFAMSSPGSLADAPYEDFSTTWAGAQLFNNYRTTSRSNSLMSSTHLSPIISPRMGPVDQTGPQNRKVASRSGSVNSVHSDWGPNRVLKSFAKSPSTGRFSPGVGDGFSTSKQERSSRRSSRQSSSGVSGRTGPLDYLALMSMKAVKAIGGACWRCKILGKKCTDENPCETCPRRSKSGKGAWASVGCKRGVLGDEMEPVALCPKSHTVIEPFEMMTAVEKLRYLVQCYDCQRYWIQDEDLTCPSCQSSAIGAIYGLEPSTKDHIFDTVTDKRERDIKKIDPAESQSASLAPFLRQIRNHCLAEDLGLSHQLHSPNITLPALVPLDECILAILWEVVEDPSRLSTVTTLNIQLLEEANQNFILLRCAALYQARLETDPHQLIAQSLICLREVLETKRAKSFGATEASFHQSCIPSHQLCNDASTSNLTSSLKRYLEQLSLVFFKKENLRGKTWWLSVFYSLVIQSFVRTYLLAVVEDLTFAVPSSIKHYLHLAVRLFIASSGDYDPLMRNWSNSGNGRSDEEKSEIRNFEEAKIAVKHAQWRSDGLASSGEYLQRLFEDDNQPIVGRAALPAERSPLDVPELWLDAADPNSTN